MNLKFVFREAFRGLGRNLTMTIALVITTAISIALVVSGILVTDMAKDTKDIYLDRVKVMVQFDDATSANDKDCSTSACADLKGQLEADDNVESVEFRNREQTYERFVELFQETDPILVEETSPDALPAELHIKLKDPSDVTPFEGIEELPQVTAVVDQAEDVRGATGNLDSIRNATFLIAAAQALAALLLIANMVQIAAFNRREEMSIMRMVGASRWTTQAPFVIEAVLATLAGVLIAGAGIFAAKRYVIDSALGGLYQAQLLAPITNDTIWVVWPLVGVAALVVSAIAAGITLRSYVRK